MCIICENQPQNEASEKKASKKVDCDASTTLTELGFDVCVGPTGFARPDQQRLGPVLQVLPMTFHNRCSSSPAPLFCGLPDTFAQVLPKSSRVGDPLLRFPPPPSNYCILNFLWRPSVSSTLET